MKNRKPMLVIGILLILLLFGFGFYKLFLLKKDIVITAKSHHWSYSCNFEEEKMVSGEGWTKPIGAMQVSSFKKQKGSEADKKDANGKVIKKGKPIYGTYYKYKVKKLVDDGSYPSRGTGMNPDYSDECKAEIADLDPDERYNQSENYFVKFVTSDGKEYSRSYSRNQWESIKNGTSFKAKTNLAGMLSEMKRI